LKEDGTLDRSKLGAIVFQDEEQRRKLNAIIHPAVRRAMALGVLKCWLRGERFCVLDVPLLIEAKIYQWVGRVVVVYWFASSSRTRGASATDELFRAAQPKYSYNGSCGGMDRRATMHERDCYRNFPSKISSSMLMLFLIIQGHRQSLRSKWMGLHGDCISKEDGLGGSSG